MVLLRGQPGALIPIESFRLIRFYLSPPNLLGSPSNLSEGS